MSCCCQSRSSVCILSASGWRLQSDHLISCFPLFPLKLSSLHMNILLYSKIQFVIVTGPGWNLLLECGIAFKPLNVQSSLFSSYEHWPIHRPKWRQMSAKQRLIGGSWSEESGLLNNPLSPIIPSLSSFLRGNIFVNLGGKIRNSALPFLSSIYLPASDENQGIYGWVSKVSSRRGPAGGCSHPLFSYRPNFTPHSVLIEPQPSFVISPSHIFLPGV